MDGWVDVLLWLCLHCCSVMFGCRKALMSHKNRARLLREWWLSTPFTMFVCTSVSVCGSVCMLFAINQIGLHCWSVFRCYLQSLFLLSVLYALSFPSSHFWCPACASVSWQGPLDCSHVHWVKCTYDCLGDWVSGNIIEEFFSSAGKRISEITHKQMSLFFSFSPFVSHGLQSCSHVKSEEKNLDPHPHTLVHHQWQVAT